MQLRRLCLTLFRDPEVASNLASVFGTALVERGFEKKKDKKGVVYYDHQGFAGFWTGVTSADTEDSVIFMRT